ncbi:MULTISPECIES: Bax inhibitor-1 family protein [Bacteroidales]|jgi:membrane protein|uniref:Bax inhibitor-1/YccA family protein n=1 Tax=Bacteroidales TaxID=171549 RepID=UPI000574F058|nr:MULTISPECIES: Bax inhibitor-1/YccA family protein [Bacteroidales]KHM45044.1 membrane protein [Coprobacter secundus]
MNSDYSVSDYQSKLAQSTLIKNVYLWMTAALAITGITAMAVSNSYAMQQFIFGSRFMFFGLIIAELALVWYVSARIQSLSFTTATGLFMLYSFINGLTLSVIFLAYTTTSIASTFFVTAGTFGAMSLYGYFTKKDLTSLGNLLFMLLIGLIIATVVNIFWANSTLYWITTYAGIFIFVGLTAYDTQKIKRLLSGQEITEESQKMALLGALSLYLDFINLFLYLLRIFGDRK